MTLPRRTRSIAIPIVIVLILGAAANVAVAWYVAYTSEWQASGVAEGMARAAGGGYLKVFWFRRLGAEDVMVVLQDTAPEPDLLASVLAPPAWVHIDETRETHGDGSEMDHAVQPPARARGWPRLAFWDTGTFTADAIAHFDRPFPMRPIWPGVVINTLFYACIFAMLYIFARVIRRALQKSRVARP